MDRAYGGEERCTVLVNAPVVIRTVYYDVEEGYDYLSIYSNKTASLTRYSRPAAPQARTRYDCHIR